MSEILHPPVFIVVENIIYEGSFTLGVFFDFESAANHIDTLTPERTSGHYYYIEKWDGVELIETYNRDEWENFS